LGSGQLGVGQRGLGQGGHSPILQGFEHVLIQGAHFGTDDLRTYFDISGCDGHSVFNIYLDISGRPGHGGTVDFNTYFVGSGTGQGAGDIALFIAEASHLGVLRLTPQVFGFGLQPQFNFGFSHTLHGHAHCGFGFSHFGHGHAHLRLGFAHTLHEPP